MERGGGSGATMCTYKVLFGGLRQLRLGLGSCVGVCGRVSIFWTIILRRGGGVCFLAAQAHTYLARGCR